MAERTLEQTVRGGAASRLSGRVAERPGLGKRAWLDTQHPVFKACAEAWAKNERRLRGGEDVLSELARFDWEKGDEHHKARRDQATYINFPDMFATVMAGHMMANAPVPEAGLNFGTLGSVPRERNFHNPTDAELVYYNADGVGNDGSQWDNFWSAALKRAMATGHRWIMVEGPEEAPGTRDRLIQEGLRPYLAEFSPLAVPMWHYQRGRLAYAILRVTTWEPRVVSGQMQSQDKPGYLLLVRKGCDLLDGGADTFSEGGWFRFDADKVLLDEGTWDDTDGEIPFFPFFYQRDGGTQERPAVSRPALSELGQVAVSYMNLSSAADFDAWDAAMSMQWLAGVDKESFNLALEKVKEGSRFAPLRPHEDTGSIPQVIDGAQGAVPSEVFDVLLRRKREEAREIASREAASTPDSSGASKRAGFREGMGSRLALIASELEQAQNTALHFLERRFGKPKPQGAVAWVRQFDLADTTEKVREIFELERVSGLRSPTLEAEAMMLAVKERQLVTDDATLQKIADEYKASGADAAERASQARSLMEEFGDFGPSAQKKDDAAPDEQQKRGAESGKTDEGA